MLSSIIVRICKFVLWVFVLLAALCFAYVALPSPLTPESQTVSNLQNGSPVIRVYDSGEFRLPRNARRAFALKWSFEANTHSLYINDNLFPLDPQHGKIQQPDNVPVEMEVMIGDQDGVNLPWFNWADATLLYHLIQPDSSVFTAKLHRYEEETSVTYQIYSAESEDRPLLTITDHDSSSRPSTPTFAFPKGPYSMSPSITYPIRRTILYILIPTVLVSFVMLQAAMVVGKIAIVCFVVWVVWALLFGPLSSWQAKPSERGARAMPSRIGQIEKNQSKEEVKEGTVPLETIV